MSRNNDYDAGQLKLAVLIDADNTQPSIAEGLLAEVAKYGVASVKRIYGDWTTTKLTQWKAKLLEYAIQPIQQFAYTTGKNATDSAMIIDAMDLLYTEKLDGSGDIVEVSFFGPYGEAVSCADGFHRRAHEYDEYGGLLEVSFYGEGGGPAADVTGAARIRWSIGPDGASDGVTAWDLHGSLLAGEPSRAL